MIYGIDFGHTVVDCTGINGKSLIESLARRCKIDNSIWSYYDYSH